MIPSSRIYQNQSPIKSFDDSFQWIIQTFDWWLGIKKGFGLLIGLWLPFLRRNDENWAGGPVGPPGPMAGVRILSPVSRGQNGQLAAATPQSHWPGGMTCSSFVENPWKKNKRNAKSKGQPWRTLKIWGKTIGKTHGWWSLFPIAWRCIPRPHGLRHTMTRPDDSGRPWATAVAGEFQICSSPCRRSLRILRHASRIPVNPSVYWSFWLFWPFQADPICLPLRFGVAGVSALAAANSHPRVSVCGARWDCHCPNLWRSEKRAPALWRCGGGAQPQYYSTDSCWYPKHHVVAVSCVLCCI